MDETVMLVLLVVVMLIGSYLAGSIPLVMSLSEEKLKVVTVFGAGLLVGTALTVIIPEGIRALYSDLLLHVSQQRHQLLQQQQQSAKAPFSTDMNVLEPLPVISDDTISDHHFEHSSTIGLSLVLGFVFMMLVDHISTKRNENGHSINATAIDHHTIVEKKNPTATIGLVVHAAADGIALGAAATTSHQDVEMIVFLAIMLHKAPAAFGLVSFLLHEGIDRNRIRKHLMIFSMSAPLLTLLTFFGIGQEQKETLNSLNATGIAMLFSAGTFLYVATVHVLPELTTSLHTGHSHHHHTHHHHHHHQMSVGSSSIAYNQLEQQMPNVVANMPKGYAGLKNIELIILITGALLPLLLTMDHHH